MNFSSFSTQLMFARLLIGYGSQDFTKNACGTSRNVDA